MDYSHNNLTHLQETTNVLLKAPGVSQNLKSLTVASNPLTLTRGYVDQLKVQLVNLKFIDFCSVEKEDSGESATKLNNIKDIVQVLFEEEIKEREREKEAANTKGGKGAKAAAAAKENAAKAAKDAKKGAKDVDPKKNAQEMEKMGSFDKIDPNNIDPTAFRPGAAPEEGKLTITFTVKTLENYDSVFFDDFEETDPENPVNTSSSYWIEYTLSNLC